MRRAPIVVVATAAGIFGVLSFHTKSASLSLPGLPGASSTTRSPTTSTAPESPPVHGTTGAGPPPESSTTTTPTTAPTTAPATTRSVTGPQVNYTYGVLAVAVTVKDKRIVDVKIASLDDGGNFRSQSIDEQSIPILEQQALQSQSANIQGVSGASYTSSGFTQSLQAALSQLGL